MKKIRDGEVHTAPYGATSVQFYFYEDNFVHAHPYFFLKK